MAASQRNADLSMLGRTLCRRARSACELCGASKVPLSPWEITPLSEEPDPDRALLLCARCRKGAEGSKLDPAEWRFMESAVWSELPAAQIQAVRIVRRLESAVWARELLEGLYLEPEIEDQLTTKERL